MGVTELIGKKKSGHGGGEKKLGLDSNATTGQLPEVAADNT